MWESIEFKLEEARFFLDQMSLDLVPPEHRSDATSQTRAIAAMPGTIVGHPWQRRFYFHLDAFLTAARSVPDIIMFQFGVDKVTTNWVAGLPQPERQNRQHFADKFGPVREGVRQHQVSTVRNITVHREGTPHVEAELVDPWGNVHQGGPTVHVDDAVLAPAAAGLAAGEYPPVPLRPNWSHFKLIVPSRSGSPTSQPLQAALEDYLEAVQQAVAAARSIAQSVYGTMEPRLTAPPLV
jgi:hypothetical protein